MYPSIYSHAESRKEMNMVSDGRIYLWGLLAAQILVHESTRALFQSVPLNFLGIGVSIVLGAVLVLVCALRVRQRWKSPSREKKLITGISLIGICGALFIFYSGMVGQIIYLTSQLPPGVLPVENLRF